MSSRTSQRTVYLVTAAIVVAMVGGFAIAAMSLGVVNNSYQGSQSTTVSSVTGLDWLHTNVSVVSGAATITNPCTAKASACDVTSNSLTICVGGFPGLTCNSGEFVENITLTTEAGTAFPSTVALTVYVTGTPVGGSAATYTGPTSYILETAAPAAAVNIVLEFAVGTQLTGPGAVTSVSVIATT